MNARSAVVAPEAALTADPIEDQRRDEVLCRMLNTPYRQLYPHRSNADRPAASTAATAPSDI